MIYYYENNLGDLGIAQGLLHSEDEVEALITLETRGKRLCEKSGIDYPNQTLIEQFDPEYHDYYIETGEYILNAKV